MPAALLRAVAAVAAVAAVGLLDASASGHAPAEHIRPPVVLADPDPDVSGDERHTTRATLAP